MCKEELKIAFLDVGHGDSIVILLPNRKNSAILIDVNEFINVKKFLDDNNVEKIEKIIITHSHFDHSKGVATLIDKLKKEGKEVKQLIFTPDRFESENMGVKYKNLFRGLVSIMNRHRIGYINPIIDDSEKVIFYDEKTKFKIAILYPNSSDLIDAVSRNNINDSSIVVEVEYNGYKVLLPGDLEMRGWMRFYNRYASYGSSKKWDVLKLPHHGEYYMSENPEEMGTRQIIDFVSPQIGIISSKQHHVYMHPNDSTIRILKERGVKVFCTQVTNICESNIDLIKNNVIKCIGNNIPYYSGCPCCGNIIISISDTIKIEPLEEVVSSIKLKFKSPQCI